MLTAASCHDLGHDGLTNSYHINAITKRAISSNDISIQEFFHTAELFKILAQDGMNFVEGFNREQFSHFRKRVTGLILATDMAKHASQ